MDSTNSQTSPTVQCKMAAEDSSDVFSSALSNLCRFIGGGGEEFPERSSGVVVVVVVSPLAFFAAVTADITAAETDGGEGEEAAAAALARDVAAAWRLEPAVAERARLRRACVELSCSIMDGKGDEGWPPPLPGLDGESSLEGDCCCCCCCCCCC